MVLVVKSGAICSVRNKMLVEKGCYRAIGRPVRDGILVEDGYFHHIM